MTGGSLWIGFDTSKSGLPKISVPPHSIKQCTIGPPPASGLMLPGQPSNGDEKIISTTSRFRVGYADTIGWRDKMEDSLALVGSFRNNPEEDYFALFDGHSGDLASKYCAKLLHTFLEKLMNEQNEPRVSLTQAFADCHESMKSTSTESGTTSVVAYFLGDQLYVANCGDSRAVISNQKKAQLITVDHKPSSESEKKRIEEIPGGYIHKNRVQGKLAVARSIGDFALNPYVTAEPEIFGPYFWKDQSRNHEILILACDGLWDVTTEEEALHVALTAKTPKEAAVRLRDDAYNKRSRDNISVMVIWFPEFIPVTDGSESSGEETDDEESGSGSGGNSEVEETPRKISEPGTPKRKISPLDFSPATPKRGKISAGSHITSPKRTQSLSLPTSPNWGRQKNIPMWKQAQLEREKKEKERKEAERMMKLRKIRGIARQASSSGLNPSVSAQALAAISPRQNSQ